MSRSPNRKPHLWIVMIALPSRFCSARANYKAIHLFVHIILATSALAQEGRPNFTGDWRFTICNPGNCPSPHIQQRIEQSDSTITISNTEDGVAKFGKKAFPTDGRQVTIHQGRYTETNTGHWEGKVLILQSIGSFPAYTGPHHGPTTTQWILSMSEDGQTMKTQIQNLADKNNVHPSGFTAQRVRSQ